ncbi:MAG: hypothetical protein RLZZ13_448 [Pseudomonadota bacterium]|jgi:hypothetical protein
MKKRIITLSQLKEINPYKYGKIITALNRNRVQPKKHKTQNFSVDFSKNAITKAIVSKILNS